MPGPDRPEAVVTELAAAIVASRRGRGRPLGVARARPGNRRCAPGAPGGCPQAGSGRATGPEEEEKEDPGRRGGRRGTGGDGPGPQLPARGRVWGGSPSSSGKRLRAAGYLIEGCSQLSVYSVTKRLRRWTAATG